VREWAKGRCAVPGCPDHAATRLGVCEAHWGMLPVGMRRAWWHGWSEDARVAVWLEQRRYCIEWLVGNGHHGISA
jgi:hypothetical protein